MKLRPVILNYNKLTWRMLQQVKHDIFRSHSKIVNLEAAVIYYAWYGRNAWHSTWTNKYLESAFFTEIEECKSWVESKRVQGSVWSITQLPALCMDLSNNIRLWLCSVNETNWWDSAIFDRETFITKMNSDEFKTSEIISCVRSNELLSLMSEKMNNFEKLDINKTCVEWKAVTFGGNYQLSWSSSSRAEHSYKGLLLILKSFHNSQEVAHLARRTSICTSAPGKPYDS